MFTLIWGYSRSKARTMRWLAITSQSSPQKDQVTVTRSASEDGVAFWRARGGSSLEQAARKMKERRASRERARPVRGMRGPIQARGRGVGLRSSVAGEQFGANGTRGRGDPGRKYGVAGRRCWCGGVDNVSGHSLLSFAGGGLVTTGVRRRAPKQAAEVRRETIVDAAIHVFAKTSYRAAGTAEIARAAGIAEPTIYRHFDSKRELYLAALARCGDIVRDEFARIAGATPEAHVALEAMGQWYAHA